MTLRPGLFGGVRQGDARMRDAGSAFALNSTRLGFDPVWGTLGAPGPDEGEHWLDQEEANVGGLSIGVDVFGNGFQISGQIRTGQFDRLSDWINVQSGFIQVRDALLVHLGQADGPDLDQRRGLLWVRLDQVILVAERSRGQSSGRGAFVVPKRRRKVSVITPGYDLQGSIHVHADGSMAQLLELPDPHFLPITDLTVRWLSSSTLVARFPFALINRAQLVTVLALPAVDKASRERSEAVDERTVDERWGAA